MFAYANCCCSPMVMQPAGCTSIDTKVRPMSPNGQFVRSIHKIIFSVCYCSLENSRLARYISHDALSVKTDFAPHKAISKSINGGCSSFFNVVPTSSPDPTDLAAVSAALVPAATAPEIAAVFTPAISAPANAAAAPPVAAVAATTAAPTSIAPTPIANLVAQLGHVPASSDLFKGLFPQYANILQETASLVSVLL